MVQSITLSQEQLMAQMTPGSSVPIARMRTGLAKDEILSLIVDIRENGGLPEGIKPDESWGRNQMVGWYIKEDNLG